MLGTLCAVLCVAASSVSQPLFLSAQPIWPQGRETEKNLNVGFRAVIDAPGDTPVEVAVTASTIYRLSVNGVFAGHGPARAAHGFFRVDVWDVTPLLHAGRNVVAFEVAGYNANSYGLLDQPSFLEAEIRAGGVMLAATGDAAHPIEAMPLDYRVQKVQRYSFQRPFSEVYRMTPASEAWRSDAEASWTPAACAVQPTVSLLPRHVPYPLFEVISPVMHAAAGTLKSGDLPANPWKDRSLTGVGPQLGGYPEANLEIIPSLEMQRYDNQELLRVDAPWNMARALPLTKNEFQIVDLGRNLTGFLCADVDCAAPTRLWLLFDEMLMNDDVNFKRLGTVNIIAYDLAPGRYTLESLEPYSMRYVKAVVLDGSCVLRDIGLRTYENPATDRAYFACADTRLNRIFEAARATFAQNAPDIFMDCPHRERAGWLCDSFFTAESALALCGDTRVEDNFLENFALPKSFAHLPAGMLPMCYPSDHNDGVFIPNWALWCVMELGAYAARGGSPEVLEAMGPKVEALFNYFAPFRNSEGLLEKLESWVFVEWSKANDFVQDVNYPSNMLYAGALETAGRLYNRPEWAAEAEKIKAVIREQSFDGTFFVDNALRKGDKLEVTQNHSEVCQYFAFFFGVATPETHEALWRTLRDDFGPKRRDTKTHSEVHMANMFIGNMLRLELLSRFHVYDSVVPDLCGYFDAQAQKTGTLWENDGAYASLNHGFASHAAVSLYRDVLGVQVDPVAKKVSVRFPETGLAWCAGLIPVGEDAVSLRWERSGQGLEYALRVPAGYTEEIDAPTGAKRLP